MLSKEMTYRTLLMAMTISLHCTVAVAQPLNERVDAGPIYKYHQAIVGWATSAAVVRGYMQIDRPELGLASFGETSDLIGRSDNRVVSLGDGGMAIFAFSEPIRNRKGPDFAVYENSFDGKYLELAFVEVSTDSIRWIRFPSYSGTQTEVQTGPFGTTDPSKLYNLAGKYKVYFGTPFDLEDIADSTGIDIDSINYVRVIDVVGSIDDQYGTRDSYGNIINDPWPTPFPQSGFDVDAVAVLNFEAVNIESMAIRPRIQIYPVPANDYMEVTFDTPLPAILEIFTTGGEKLLSKKADSHIVSLSVANYPPGIYIMVVRHFNTSYSVKRFVKI